MRLFNTIAVFDVFVVANTGDSAREALLAWIHDETLEPNEIVAVEVSRSAAIRAACRELSPIVAADVSDSEYAEVLGKTTIEIFQYIYEKRG